MKRLKCGAWGSGFPSGRRQLATLLAGIAAFALATLVVPGSSEASIIALFNFNDMQTNNNGTTAVTVNNSVGVPTLQLVEDGGAIASGAQAGQTGNAFTDQAGTSHAAGRAAAWTSGVLNTSTNPNDTWVLGVNTTNYNGLALRFDYRFTDTVLSGETLQGPTQLTIDWRQGGGSFTPLPTFNLTRDNNFHAFSLDLSGIAAIQNATNVEIRGTWSNDGVKSGTSTTFPSVRLDNMQLTGVPEPTALAVLAWAVAYGSLNGRRRWRTKREV